MANIKDALLQAYAILEFAPREIDAAISDIIARQQQAAIEILMRDMNPEELASLHEKSTQGPEEERIKEFENLFIKRDTDNEFNAKIAAAMSGILAEHIGQLKMMGDDAQKTRLEQLFRGSDLDK
jgi:hypothetical protein